jgi:hypothetical protein
VGPFADVRRGNAEKSPECHPIVTVFARAARKSFRLSPAVIFRPWLVSWTSAIFWPTTTLTLNIH